jgi:hypothetical protein
VLAVCFFGMMRHEIGESSEAFCSMGKIWFCCYLPKQKTVLQNRHIQRTHNEVLEQKGFGEELVLWVINGCLSGSIFIPIPRSFRPSLDFQTRKAN